MPAARIVKLRMDDAGESFFEDVDVPLKATDFAPPAPPLDLAPIAMLGQGFFLGGTKAWAGTTPHPAPRKQVFVVMQGAFTVEASSGETRRFEAGSVLWLEDTGGKGHKTRIVGDVYTIVFGAEIRD